MSGPEAGDGAVRLHVYRHFLARGAPPSAAETGEALGMPEPDAAAAYVRLAAERALVLRPGTHDVLMAPPLSAVPTRFLVRLGDGRAYWGNCVWDALGVPAMLGVDGVVEASCPDCEAPLRLAVREGALAEREGVVHFAVPAARWWEDIVFT